MPGSRVASGEDVTLRTVEREDCPFLQRAYANPSLRRPLGRDPTSLHEIEQAFENGELTENRQQYLICLDDPDAGDGVPDESAVERIGLFVARDVEYRPNIAIWIIQGHHGHGHGTEAASLAIDLLFRNYDVPSIGAGVCEFNEASQALLESLGFSLEGRQRKVQFQNGTYHDNLKYGILREEWAEQRDS